MEIQGKSFFGKEADKEPPALEAPQEGEGLGRFDFESVAKTKVLLGHESHKKNFVRQILENRLHHAFLLKGPEGVGKATFAFQCARLLAGWEDMRRQDKDFLEKAHRYAYEASESAHSLAEEAFDPFLAVLSTKGARQVMALSHGDVHYIAPDPEKKSARILIGRIREAQKTLLHQSPLAGGYRTILIDPADSLTQEAANALLKNLEDPGQKTVFFLITAEGSLLMPTIVSRCLQLSFRPLEDSSVRRLLEIYDPALEGGSLAVASFYAQGSVGRALRFLSHNGLAFHEACLDLLENLSQKTYGDIIDFAERYGKDPSSFSLSFYMMELLLTRIVLSTCAPAAPLPFSVGHISRTYTPESLLSIAEGLGEKFSLVQKGLLEAPQSFIEPFLFLKDRVS